MNLFDSPADPTENLLPGDGIVNYHGKILDRHAADTALEALLKKIDWQHDEAVIYGKHITTKRKVAWYGDKEFAYRYSNTTKYALPWTAELQALKLLTEQHCKAQFNSCLLNLYHDGGEGMAWHSDAEKELVKHGIIGSISLGAKRRFLFKHKLNKHKVEVQLEHGSLLVMRGKTQDHWLHSLPKSTRIHEPRVNLTFRTIRT